MQPHHQASAARDRSRAYLAGAAVVTSLWPLEYGLLGAWPLDALCVRLWWSGVLLLCAFLVNRNEYRWVSLVGSLSSVGSTAALALLAGLTGGSESPYFPIVPFIALLVSQVEPQRAAPTIAATATAVIASAAMIVHEGGSPFFLATWLGFVLFVGWWAAYWHHRAQQRADARSAAEKREAELERDKARAVADLAVAARRSQQAERLALVGRVAAGVAHELNNPLAFVRSNLELLAQLGAQRNDAALREMAEESLQGVDRISQIATDLRRLSRDPGDSTEEVRATDAIDEAMRLASLRLRRVRHLDLEVAPDLPLLFCQRGRLVQVLINLLANAADAVEHLADSRVRITAGVEHGNLLLVVEDNGPGIPPEMVEQIFDPFFTTKEDAGMGLGLPLCREFALRLGGGIEAGRSELGGARFALYVPDGTQHAQAA